MTVKIYSTATCAYCVMAKKFLSDHKIPFQEIRVDLDHGALQEMVKKTNQMGVPVIDVDGKIMIGFNQKVLADLVGIKE